MSGPTPSLRRALEVIGSHRHVQTVRPLDEAYNKVEVDFLIPMPSRWRGAGQSQTGVRPIETVTFTFDESFPLVAPQVTLRQDFDRSHPHIQPGCREDPPRPCYFEGDPHDLLRYTGIEGIVEQVADWLEKASSGSLIDFEQGWEPIRRDSINDTIEVNPDFVRSFVDRDGGFSFTLIQHAAIHFQNTDRYRAVVVEHKRRALNAKFFDQVAENSNIYGLSAIIWAGRNPSGELIINDRYEPETVQTVHDLDARSTDYAMHERFRSAIKLIRRALGTRRLATPLVLTVFLVVRRPAHIIGQGSPLELIPYVIEVNSADDLVERSLHLVRPAAIRDSVSRDLLASMAGPPNVGRKIWSLLGCGSVGSKLALHLARQGLAPTTVLDRSLIHPHNYARHALLPPPTLPVPEPKSHAVARAMMALGQASTPVPEDLVAAAAARSPTLAAAWPPKSEFIVDATASPSVTDALCLPDVARNRPRAIEICLLGRGSVGYLAIEGFNSNPSVQDLQAESYRLIANDHKLRSVALVAPGDVISVGQGCSSRTATMTDAKLSSFIPAMAQRVAYALQNGLPSDCGEILLGIVDDDLMNHDWKRQYIPPFRRLRSTRGTVVSVSKHVMNCIGKGITSNPDVENGGILLGRFNDTTDSFHVIDVLGAPPDSKFSATEFTLGTEGLVEQIRAYSNAVNGVLYPIGTWHNHLADTSASMTDLATAAALSLGQRFPVCLLIFTPGSLRGVIADTGRSGSGPRVHINFLEEEM